MIAADGARSTMRDLMGLEFKGHTFEEKFLIADVRMPADDLPTERRFWFDPPFHSGQSALMHRQPDESWRIDLQLGPDADIEQELKPENYLPRIRKMVGERDFHVDWVSIYRFNCRRIDRFVHGRVIFVGDSAHQVSPFGARGANSGVEDAENLAWKLAAVLRRRGGRGPDRKLRSRAHAGGRREYRAFDPLDRFHRAAFAGRAHPAQRRAVARAACRLRPTHGEFRTAFGRDRLRHAAIDAG